MQLTLVTLLCMGVAIASGAVRPLVMPMENHEKLHIQRQYPYALLLPLTDNTARQLATGELHLEVVKSEDQEVVPQELTRVRRQLTTSTGIDHTNLGTTLSGQATQHLYTSPDKQHTFNANAHVSKTFNIPDYGTGPTIYGGGATYDHATRGGAKVDLTRTPQGNQFNAEARGTVWQSQDRNGRVDVAGTYGRTYGGPYGTGRPDYGIRATYTHNFR